MYATALCHYAGDNMFFFCRDFYSFDLFKVLIQVF